MLKSILVLPDGTELACGPRADNPIMSLTLTECVNDGEELTLGSAVASVMDAAVLTYGGLELTAGEEVTLYKELDDGTRRKMGVFIMEKPSKVSANKIKITGFDRLIRLDRELSGWLDGLTGWPYSLTQFAGMVCAACGLTFVTGSLPNGNFPVRRFLHGEVTGRQLMQWVGEVSGCFCRADADGRVELAWYTPCGKTVTPSGEYRYFAKGLKYEAYEVAPIEAVQLKLADSSTGALWPEVEDGANTYVISGNPLLSEVSSAVLPYLEVLRQRLAALRYTPCTVAMPANLEIRAGSTVDITDTNGVTVTACVMRKTASGQRDTLECTGSYRRDTAGARAEGRRKQESKAVNELLLAVRALDGDKVASLINLSEGGVKIQGQKINLGGVVTANQNFKILSDGSAVMRNADVAGKITATSGTIGGCTLQNGVLQLQNANADGITAQNVSLTGHIVAQTGKIADWNIGTKVVATMDSAGHIVTLYDGPAIYSDTYYVNGSALWTTLTPAGIYVARPSGETNAVYYASWIDLIQRII